MTSLFAFAVSIVLSLVLTHRVRSWAVRMGIVDRPDGVRRLHDRPIPRVGGMAIYASVATVLLIGLALGLPALDLPRGQTMPFVAVMAGGAVIFALGLWDDILGLAAWTKFIVELLVAAAVFALGVRLDAFGLPGGEVVHLPLMIALPVTMLWIVGLTNAFNLIDGSDGIAGGAAVFAAISIAAVSVLSSNELGTVVALTLGGATLGFLFYNFPPASIFLGDSGSLYLGFTLATLGILTTQTASTALAVAIPVVSCGLPILDTLLAMTRRFLRGERIFNPDRGHIHHRLRDLGHSPRKVALIMYAACAGFALLSLLLVQPAGRMTAVLFVAAGTVVWVGVQRLRVPELLEIQRIVARGFQQRTAIAHNVRIRNAITRMRRAEDPRALLDALASAFEGGEFARVECWLPGEVAAPLAGCRSVVLDGDGVLWRWNAPNCNGNGRYWEMRFPFFGGAEHPIGRLSLWLPATTSRLTDSRLILDELQPEFWRALLRLQPPKSLESAVMISVDAFQASALSTE